MAKEYPILFSGEMVRAILNGTKTQTRRIIKPRMTTPRVPPIEVQPWIIDGEQETDDRGRPLWVGSHPDYPTGEKWFSCDYGMPGDRLWVRETWGQTASNGAIYYRADGIEHNRPWKTSIHMPRVASRLVLEVRQVRVMHLQSITYGDALAEGISRPPKNADPDKVDREYDEIAEFRALWDSINHDRPGASWQDNPWVWAITFDRVQS